MTRRMVAGAIVAAGAAILLAAGPAAGPVPAPATVAGCAPIVNYGDAYPYPDMRPTCHGGRLELAGQDVPEDAYGWNCYSDGNGSCGTGLEATAPGCVTIPADGYTMCRDGRVYVLEAGRPVGIVWRVLA